MKEKDDQINDNNHNSNNCNEGSLDVVSKEEVLEASFMIKEEPKSPKGEKASEKYWDICRHVYAHDLRDNSVVFALHDNYKATYDRLVTLEAKIEVLEELSDMHHAYCLKHDLVEQGATKAIGAKLIKYQSEYDQLIKEHNL